MSRFQIPQDNWSDRDKDFCLRDISRRVIVDSFVWDPGAVGANSYLDTALTSASYPALTGLRTGCFVSLTPPSTLDNALSFYAWVPGNDSLTIRLINRSGGSVNMGSATWAFLGVIL